MKRIAAVFVIHLLWLHRISLMSLKGYQTLLQRDQFLLIFLVLVLKIMNKLLDFSPPKKESKDSC
jgi:hypothetical protein